jgi:L-aspartate oxidase
VTERLVFDGVIVVGGGLAGLCAALAAAPRRVLLLSPAPLGRACSSAWAQGGMAAAVAEDDSAELHARDTEAAGAGLVDPIVARRLTQAARDTVERLVALGAPFDRDEQGRLVQSLEAAHSRARVARVGGDGAGAAILASVAEAVRRAPHVEVVENARVRGLLQDGRGRVRGAVAERAGRLQEIAAAAVVLATGGIGGLYAVTTTPRELTGDGLALAALAGAEVLDPEFVQFHPTAIDVGLDPAPLATEALRGEGAVLVDRYGRRFMPEVHPAAELAPRDVVARAVAARLACGAGAFLDCRTAVHDFAAAFPTVFAACMGAGVDPRTQPVPVAPAVHYHMGGIAARPDGRTSVPGLYAVGECAATGVHGANRLASNSLLEAAAFGFETGCAAAAEVAVAAPLRRGDVAADLPADALQTLRRAMSRHAGVVRDGAGLTALLDLFDGLEAAHGRVLQLVAARLIAAAALDREESRGGHFRADFPTAAAEARHSRLTLADLDHRRLPLAAE